jgi:hypothetical protein
MQGTLCGHMLEKCPNCIGNPIVFSSRCTKKSKAAKAAWQSRKTGTAGCAPTNDAMCMAMRTNRVLLGRRLLGEPAADGGCEAEEMADVQGEVATWEARDIEKTETETVTTAPTAIETETETDTGALPTSD